MKTPPPDDSAAARRPSRPRLPARLHLQGVPSLHLRRLLLTFSPTPPLSIPFARIRAVRHRHLLLPTTAGGRIEASALRWTLSDRGHADTLILTN